jgi:hypothetical protein
MHGIVKQNQKSKSEKTEKMKWFKKRKPETPTNQPTQHQTGSKLPLNHVYTAKDGTKWFEYTNPLTIPARRSISAEVATRFAEMNLTKDNLLTLIDGMKRNANNGNIVELFNILAEIEFRLDYIGEEKTLLELATCYFVIDGEDETDFAEIWRNKKMQMLESDGSLKDFFLQRAFVITTKYSELSETDILDYLKTNGPANERFKRVLHKLKLQNTSMK